MKFFRSKADKKAEHDARAFTARTTARRAVVGKIAPLVAAFKTARRTPDAASRYEQLTDIKTKLENPFNTHASSLDITAVVGRALYNTRKHEDRGRALSFIANNIECVRPIERFRRAITAELDAFTSADYASLLKSPDARRLMKAFPALRDALLIEALLGTLDDISPKTRTIINLCAAPEKKPKP